MITNRQYAMQRLERLTKECTDENFALWLVEKLIKAEQDVEASKEGLFLICNGASWAASTLVQSDFAGAISQLKGAAIIAKETLDSLEVKDYRAELNHLSADEYKKLHSNQWMPPEEEDNG